MKSIGSRSNLVARQLTLQLGNDSKEIVEAAQRLQAASPADYQPDIDRAVNCLLGREHSGEDALDRVLAQARW